ncbi:hypothetical protein [Bacillus mycoides]|nr:hypothetical protein [Bacillus mycoides]MCQ6360567.1 hypothetical protein [Bacillus cereus]
MNQRIKKHYDKEMMAGTLNQRNRSKLKQIKPTNSQIEQNIQEDLVI